MEEFFNFYNQYRFLMVPFFTWFGIQVFKLIWDLSTTGKINFRRLLGAGGMPSAHSAVVVSLTTMIGRSQGITSPIFAIAFIFSLIVMYDACGVRYETGKQAHVLNEMMRNPEFEILNINFNGKLEELVGHTPFQVAVGALIGLIIGLIF